MQALEDWHASGGYRQVDGRRLFVVDRRPEQEEAEPVVILHGFPSCSFDWRAVVPHLDRRRVVAFDMLGYGFSEKPLDHAYSLFEQADLTVTLLGELGIDRFALVTHDMGDSVGGEILARSIDGDLSIEITRRVLTNGSIYMDLVQLSAGQELLLSMPDEALSVDDAITEELFKPGLAATFGPSTQPTSDELEAQWRLLSTNDGHRVLPRLIRYIGERRVHGKRWTGAIEAHPSPLSIIWGQLDPIAVPAMATRLADARPDASITRLEAVGHYPMIEDPPTFVQAVRAGLA